MTSEHAASPPAAAWSCGRPNAQPGRPCRRVMTEPVKTSNIRKEIIR
jgi:hypothetical protein